MKNITVYSGPLCAFCDAAKRLLGRNNLEYLPKQMFKQNKLIMSLILYENIQQC